MSYKIDYTKSNSLESHLSRFYQDAGLRVEVMQQDRRWWSFAASKGKPVTSLDPFQSFSDLQNDVAGLFIKPGCQYYLSYIYFRQFAYEFLLTLVHGLTLNFPEAGSHGLQSLMSLGVMFFLTYSYVFEIIFQTLSLAMRLAITVIESPARLYDFVTKDVIAPSKSKASAHNTYQQLFGNYNLFKLISDEVNEAYKEAGIRAESMKRASWWSSQPHKNDRQVTCLDEFQSVADFQNDVVNLFARPLTCFYLFSVHGLKVFYELGLSCVHLITLNPYESTKHFLNVVTSFVSVYFYFFATIAEAVAQTLSLMMRSSVSLARPVCESAAKSGFFGARPSSDNDKNRKSWFESFRFAM